ncbi:MAG: OmpA family protein [Mariniphaga sp.]
MYKYIIVILCLIITYNSKAQKLGQSEKKADALYSEAKIQATKGDRLKAITLLNQIIKIDSQYYLAYFGLADIYHGTGQRTQEKDFLIKGLEIAIDRFPRGYKYIAEILFTDAEYEEALKNIEQFNRLKKPLTADENQLLESCRFAVKAIKTPVPFQPENAGPAINTPAEEYWPSLNGESNALIFTRLIKNDSTGKKIFMPQEDFYLSRTDSNSWQKAKPLGPPINTDDNEGAQCISPDGRLLFFTGCSRGDGLGSCDIYMSVKKKGIWSEPVNLGSPVNSTFWESQPSISADGRWLYFTSNRKGGKGQMDIWRAEQIAITKDGFPVYGKVVNMESLNTPGNDNSPFIHADGKTLYFASDYWPGMGGKDLFVVQVDSIKSGIPRNLGYPINTSKNEEGLVVEVSGKKAWFTSNQSGFGGRDIFTFSLPEQDRPELVSWVKGFVSDKITGRVVLAEIGLNDLVSNQLVQHLYPFENDGEFLFCLPSRRNYGLSIGKEGYLFHSENFNLLAENSRQQPLNLNIKLEPIAIGTTTILKNIFFETDSFRLKSESTEQLLDIVDFMKKNPKLVVEIGGHTDNQGSESYNLNLSAKRADAVVKYLVDSGIVSSRLKSKGYGFSKPIADNSTEEGKARNRRTEFKILALK